MSDIEQTQEIVESERELTSFEQKMVEKGWDPNGKKTAEQWLDDGYEMRGKDIDKLHKTVDYIKSYVSRKEQQDYQKSIADLQYQKQEAIELGDSKRVYEIEQQQSRVMNPEILAMVDEFSNRNRDWLQNPQMKSFCDWKDNELAGRNLHPAEHLRQLEEAVKTQFPDYFNGRSGGSPIVEGRQSGVVKSSYKRGFTFDDLDESQKAIAKMLERKGVMKTKDYIADLVKTGVLK